MGPANYIVSGFITVSDEEIEKIEQQFSFEKSYVQFPKDISPEDTGYTDFNWCYNAEFEKWVEAGRWIGEAYYDLNNKIIYVYVAVK